MAQREHTDYYTVEELAERWNVTPRAIRKWVAAGDFPNAYKVGLGLTSPIRIPIADVEEFERKRKIRP